VTEFVVVIGQEGESWGTFEPDLPGRVAAGDSRHAVEALIGDGDVVVAFEPLTSLLQRHLSRAPSLSERP
jgi:hypothetical protein